MKILSVLLLITVLSVYSCKSRKPVSPAGTGPSIRESYVFSLWKGGDTARLQWKKAAGDDVEYRLFLSESPYMTNVETALKLGTEIFPWTPDIRDYTLTNLKPGTIYYAALAARNGSGISLYQQKEICTRSRKYTPEVPVRDPGTSLPEGWWKKAVFYEVFVRSFQDSDGDGKGDLKGLISRLDYLKSLGIGGIWLMPVAESSDNDHGYHVIDYRAIESDYGTMEDFSLLLAEAHKRGIGIIVDFVLNHSSSEHPFFKDASTNINSPYRSWYWFESGYPGKWQIPEGSPDAWVKTATGYYFGFLVPSIPDLQFHNPDVQTWMEDNLRFWLNMGVDGYRYDAVMNLVENGKDKTINQPETHAYYQRLRAVTDQYKNRTSVCEHGDPAYFGNGTNEFHMAFSFGFSFLAMESLRSGNAAAVKDYAVRYLKAAPEGSRYALFLNNHDFPFGARLSTQLSGSIPRLKLAAALLLTMPGVPFIYYGEEIGMPAQYLKYGDASLRTPMQWDLSTNNGFTSGKPYRRMNTNNNLINVQTQHADPESLLSFYRSMIQLRNSLPELHSGKFELLNISPASALAYTMSADKGRLLVILNLSDSGLDLSSTRPGNLRPVSLIYDSGPVVKSGMNSQDWMKLPPYGIRIMRLD